MTRHICSDCQTSIPNGDAYLRSVAFEQVAFCFDCWAARQPLFVPTPRTERSPLSKRVARAAGVDNRALVAFAVLAALATA